MDKDLEWSKEAVRVFNDYNYLSIRCVIEIVKEMRRCKSETQDRNTRRS